MGEKKISRYVGETKIKKILANKSNLTENQVTRWLQNKRARQSNQKITKRLSNEIKKSLKKSFSKKDYKAGYFDCKFYTIMSSE